MDSRWRPLSRTNNRADCTPAGRVSTCSSWLLLNKRVSALRAAATSGPRPRSATTGAWCAEYRPPPGRIRARRSRSAARLQASVVAVVVQIDAADKRGVGVDQRQLAVQAAQAAAARPPAHTSGRKTAHSPRPRAGRPASDQENPHSKAIQQHIDFHPRRAAAISARAMRSPVASMRKIWFQLDLPPAAFRLASSAGKTRRRRNKVTALWRHSRPVRLLRQQGGRQRQVIRQLRPRRAVMHLRLGDAQATRCKCGPASAWAAAPVAACMRAVQGVKHLAQANSPTSRSLAWSASR